MLTSNLFLGKNETFSTGRNLLLDVALLRSAYVQHCSTSSDSGTTTTRIPFSNNDGTGGVGYTYFIYIDVDMLNAALLRTLGGEHGRSIVTNTRTTTSMAGARHLTLRR